VTAALLVLAALLAVADWSAVAGAAPAPIRAITKPGTMVALIAAVLAGGAGGAVQTWMVTGLVLSLAGDVLLMLAERWFIAGLGSFLLAHLAYVVAMAQLELAWVRLAAAAAIIVVGWMVAGRAIVAGAAGRAPELRIPVAAYITVISAMVAVAVMATESGGIAWWLPVAALCFYASDAILGTNRFVEPRRGMPLAVMVTYHLAQGAFVAFLLRR